MFDPKSRYHSLPNRIITNPDGSEDVYKARRILPIIDQGDSAKALDYELTVGPEQRLDTIAYTELGDPLAFWRVADANFAMNPFALTLPGTQLVFPGAHHSSSPNPSDQGSDQ